jgi:hypothetical protein
MKKSKWDDEPDYWVDDEGPAWWEIAVAAVVMVLVIAILVYSSWAAS